MNARNFIAPTLQGCSAVYGKIETMLLIYPGTASEVDAEKIRKRYGSVFKAFGDRVTFIVLANNVKIADHRAEYEITQKFEEAMVSSHLFPLHHVIVIGTALPKDAPEKQNTHGFWAQDPFVVLNDGKGQVALLEPMFHTHPQNALLAEQLASNANILLKPTRYFLEGGNILVGDDFALIGRLILKKNYDAYFGHLSEPGALDVLTAEFKRLLGVKYLIWVGFNKPQSMPLGLLQDSERLQPLFHIDLFLTLGGKHPDTGDEVLFVGTIPSDGVQCEPTEKEKWQDSIKIINEALNEIAIQLVAFHEKQAGPKFQIERMPMGIVIDKHGKADVYSYNNAHVEWYHGIKRFYLPKYPDFAKDKNPLESKVGRLLSGLRYKCNFIDNSFERYVKYGHGSLHCLSKVLTRGNY